MKQLLANLAVTSIVASAALPSVFHATPALAQAVPQGYLIGSAAPLTEDEVVQLQAEGATVRHVYKNFGGAAVAINAENLDGVRALSFVTSVSADRVRHLHAAQTPAPAAPLPGTPYWHDLINAETNTQYDGTGVWVAVLDTGFYPNWRDYFDESRILTDLASAFVSIFGNRNDNQWDAGSSPHGMAVAATVVGYRFADDTNEGGWGEGYAAGSAGTYRVPGVAPGAKIIPVKACEPSVCLSSAISAGIDYVTGLKLASPDQPIVINLSLGAQGAVPVENAAIAAATRAGVVVVGSAGNDGDEGMNFPAAYEPVISVGAGGWRGQWNDYPDKTWWLDDPAETGVNDIFVAGFSSRQKPGQYLDLIATGRFLLLPYPCAQLYKDGAVTPAAEHRACASKAAPNNARSAPFQYVFVSGTSFSAPTLSGIVALMLQKNPALNNADAVFGTFEDPASWGSGSLERLLESIATPIPPGSANVTHRTGETVTESWGQDATGHGWVFVDDVLAAVP